MKCTPIDLGNGMTGIVCTTRRKRKPCACGRSASLECDFPNEKRKSKTCDAPICDQCARRISPNVDHCRAHDAPPVSRADAKHPLVVQTARMGYRGEHWLDVSHQGNMRRAEAGEVGGHRGIGLLFAPSPSLLYPYLSKRRFGKLTREDWLRYREQYTNEMRQAFRQSREPWDLLLRTPHVVLLCMCTDGSTCHRRVLAEILAKLGATDAGEVT